MSPLLQDIFNFFIYSFLFIHCRLLAKWDSVLEKEYYSLQEIDRVSHPELLISWDVKRIFMNFFLQSTFWFEQIPLVCFLKYNTFRQFEGDHFSRPDMFLFVFQVHLVSPLIKSILSSVSYTVYIYYFAVTWLKCSLFLGYSFWLPLICTRFTSQMFSAQPCLCYFIYSFFLSLAVLLHMYGITSFENKINFHRC